MFVTINQIDTKLELTLSKKLRKNTDFETAVCPKSDLN